VLCLPKCSRNVTSLECKKTWKTPSQFSEVGGCICKYSIDEYWEGFLVFGGKEFLWRDTENFNVEIDVNWSARMEGSERWIVAALGPRLSRFGEDVLEPLFVR